MRYFTQDVSRFEGIKEYVDTAIVGLIRLAFREDRAEEMERVMEISAWLEEVEREYQGRLFLFPPFFIYGDDPIPFHFASLRTSFKHVLLVPFQEELGHLEGLSHLKGEEVKGNHGVLLLNKPNSPDDLYEQIVTLWNG